MRRLSRWRGSRPVGGRLAILAAVGLIGALLAAPGAIAATHHASHPARTAAASTAKSTACSSGRMMCTEIENPEAFGEGTYVGHDEPSLVFYSSQAGSGNSAQYRVILPTDPAGPFSSTKSYDIQLRPTFWFGMAMCDTQSFPEQVSTCPPDSDSNILGPARSPNHVGSAFMELQLYPPGYVKQFTGFSCDATKWCAAMTIDSLARDPVAGQDLNGTCQSEILGGLEYVNFAYLTKSGVPQGPPNPKEFDFEESGDPGSDVAYFNQGDALTVTMHDTAHGLYTQITDTTTGVTGSMTASAANGFGQIQFAPTGSSCTEIPYDFHPMYSTSSPATRVIWAAHSYNVSQSDEIGHFDLCSSTAGGGNSCNEEALEGVAGDQETSDGDDNYCFTGAESTNYPLTGCLDTNSGFDGTSYQPDWPDGSPNHPTSQFFSNPLTGPGGTYTSQYQQVAFETDTPRIEAADFGGLCDRSTGVGCTIVPRTDDEGRPLATFYPFYSLNSLGRNVCMWGEGNDLPTTVNDFGKTAQYGSLLKLDYILFGGGGAFFTRFNDYRQIIPIPTACGPHPGH